MAELQDVLQRRRGEVRPEPGAFERLKRRRDRRRRAQTVSTAVVALILAGIAIWGLTHAFTRRDSMPASRPIRPENVSRLKLAWSTPSTGANAISPPASRDEVYVTGSTVRAYPRTCAVATCGTRWVGDRGGTHEVADVAIGARLVFIASGDDLSGFPKDCARGGVSCAPTWMAPISSFSGFSAISVAGGVVYALAENNLYAFPERCSLSCRPLWRAHCSVSCQISHAPVSVGGEASGQLGEHPIFVQDDHVLEAFPAVCRMDGGRCSPTWRTRTESLASRPIYADGRVYAVRGPDEVAAYPARCRHGSGCPPESVWRVPNANALAVSGLILYVATSDRVLAFPTACPLGAPCRPAWQTPSLPGSPSVPTVANGLVFFTTGDRVYATPVDCGSGGATCSPVWSARLPGGAGSSLSPPTVTDRQVFIVSAGGTLYAFQVPAG